MIRAMIICLLFSCLAGAAPAGAQEPATPLVDGYIHTGVASCSTAGCHGDQVVGVGAGPVVGQNEYFKWRSSGVEGSHSRAYEVLFSSQAQRIARNLGIGPAHEAGECLDCHADNVPKALRTDRFQISDGVGCEACHGGAENWLAFHRVSAGHDENISKGLYPTEDPAARAALCLGCHLGSEKNNQFISHRVMGAGHPRLKFELDLYTAIQRHHQIDDDYLKRKPVAPGARVWATGQVVAAKRTLEMLLNDAGKSGIFPEFAFFDCHACHQPISDSGESLDWRGNPARGLGPGAPILNDANVIMLLAIARAVDPALGERLERDNRSLQGALQRDRTAFRETAASMLAVIDDLATRISLTDFSDRAYARAILSVIVSPSFGERYTNYAAAEQALFAVQRLTADLGDGSATLANAIERASLYAQSPYTYNQSGFNHAFADIGAVLPRKGEINR